MTPWPPRSQRSRSSSGSSRSHHGDGRGLFGFSREHQHRRGDRCGAVGLRWRAVAAAADAAFRSSGVLVRGGDGCRSGRWPRTASTWPAFHTWSPRPSTRSSSPGCSCSGTGARARCRSTGSPPDAVNSSIGQQRSRSVQRPVISPPIRCISASSPPALCSPSRWSCPCSGGGSST